MRVVWNCLGWLCLGCGSAGGGDTPVRQGDTGRSDRATNAGGSASGFVRSDVGCGELRTLPELDRILELHRTFLMSSGAEGAQADLSCVDLRGANLRGAMLDRADLHGAVCNHETELGAVSLKQADVRGVDFTHAYLIGAALDGADASGADFSDTVLVNATFIGTTLTEASLLSVNALYVKYVRAAFDGTYVDLSSLAGADVSGADLRGARSLVAAELHDACGDAETKLPSGLSVEPCTSTSGP